MVLLPVYERTRIICPELEGCLLIYARVILGLSPPREEKYCGCSRARCYEEYLDLRSRKERRLGEIAC